MAPESKYVQYRLSLACLVKKEQTNASEKHNIQSFQTDRLVADIKQKYTTRTKNVWRKEIKKLSWGIEFPTST